MKKILILTDKEDISFSSCNTDSKEKNLNNTNVINTNKLIFSEDYINDNFELVTTFISLLVIKKHINKATLFDLDSAIIALNIIKKLASIKCVHFSCDRELSYEICSLLLENKNIEKIDCYSLPEIMFEQFEQGVVNTRSEVLFTSSFMEYNKINTYSLLCNKDKITIDGIIDKYDIEDLEYLLEKNKRLKKIVVKNYDRDSLIIILKLLKDYNHSRINVIIYEDINCTKKIISDINLLGKISREYNVKIQVRYSKEYREKNGIKQLNISLLKMIFLIIIGLSLVILLLIRNTEHENEKTVNSNIELVNDTIEEVVDNTEVINDTSNISLESSEENPYYINYDKIYSKLLNINSDTIGFLTINNTNINYPVVQTIDNDYYLNHSYDKTINSAGWVFVDYRNNMENIDNNTIIYAHAVSKPVVMFGELKKVLDSNWYMDDKNLTISFNIKDKILKWRIFSIYTIPKTSDYLMTSFDDDSFEKFLTMIKERSIHDFKVKLDAQDKILTLSTCYNNSNYRLVVHAVMK